MRTHDFPLTRDADTSDAAALTYAFAAIALGEAMREADPAPAPHKELVAQAVPPVTHITMEDPEQSAGATATSLRAAYILAHLDDEDDDAAPVCTQGGVPDHRPCAGRTPYCG